ncbi:E3 ubiquitin-protein ligase DDB_G0292642 isoform X2 [Nelusetta ayraudi]|uniref:E3 ubiquitin-protein ligase DDB_G0292642 isoform X2 n=1 Tax=Nelusetta ayraudi TaxID=303726 RepID=UPI003F719985
MTSSGQNEKRYDPRDTTLKFVKRPDDLDPYHLSLRAEMSCGHAVTPESLTAWCRSLLDQGQYRFLCPALKDGTVTKCNAMWPYAEVRRLAVLTPQEMQHFEEKMAPLAAARYCEFKACPGCKTNVERKDLTNLNVHCPICTIDKEKTYQFCWQCLEPWKGRAPRSDRCDNEGCTNRDLELLKNCKLVALPQVLGVTACPSIRACPTCGMKVEHDKTGCKNIICPRCNKEFCFVCLKLTPECLKTSTHYKLCSMAPRQTSVPVWRRH